LCQFFWLWREIDLKMRTRYYKKILLGALMEAAIVSKMQTPAITL
jgi:hypothetical protein